MGVISRSAQALVSFVGSRLPALACMIELVVRCLQRACLTEGSPADESILSPEFCWSIWIRDRQ